VAEHAKVDIGAWQIWNPMTFEIDAIGANHLRQEWIALTPAIADDLQFLQTNLGTADFFVDSQSADRSKPANADIRAARGARACKYQAAGRSKAARELLASAVAGLIEGTRIAGGRRGQQLARLDRANVRSGLTGRRRELRVL
jgi:hypothetical protein